MMADGGSPEKHIEATESSALNKSWGKRMVKSQNEAINKNSNCTSFVLHSSLPLAVRSIHLQFNETCNNILKSLYMAVNGCCLNMMGQNYVWPLSKRHSSCQSTQNNYMSIHKQMHFSDCNK